MVRVSSVEPPSATSTWKRSAGYRWVSNWLSVEAMKAASLRRGTMTETNGTGGARGADGGKDRVRSWACMGASSGWQPGAALARNQKVPDGAAVIGGAGR